MGSYDLLCARCGAAISPAVFHKVCPACDGDIAFRYDLSDVRLDRDLPGIWRFIDLLPLPGHIVVGVLTGFGHRETHVLVERGEAPLEVITSADGKQLLARFLGERRSVGRVVA